MPTGQFSSHALHDVHDQISSAVMRSNSESALMVISGTVDRLCIGPDRVQVVDFKTGRIAPLSVEEVPAAHVRQMAAYAAALQVIFPDRRIEAALLYTSAPRLITLPHDLLAAHKPGFPPAQENLPPSPVETDASPS